MSKSTKFILEDPSGELTDRQKFFCSEYIATKFNGTQAAINAGYSKKTADQQASRLLTNVKIDDYIKVLKKDLGTRLGITRERIANEFAKLAFFDVRKILADDGTLKNISELDDDTAGAIVGVEIYEEKIGLESFGINKKVKICDKRAALSDLNKMLGYNEPEKKELTGKNGTPLTQPFNDSQVDKIIQSLRENKTS